MRRGWLFVALAIVFAISSSFPVSAQVPTAEQLELLQSMSPEDREALMEQLGIGGSIIDTPSRGSESDSEKRRRNSDEETREERRERMEFEQPQKERPFAPDDSLLIDIDFKKDKPPRVESAGPGAKDSSCRWTLSGRAIPTSSMPAARCNCRALPRSCSRD
jgi:hypothetical protein